MAETFPTSLDALNADWLSDALRRGGALPQGAAVLDFEVLPIGSGFGQTGDSVRLRPRYRGDVPATPPTVFAKFATGDTVRRAASRRLDLYRREVDFYRRLAPMTPVRAPRCYFAAASADGDLATLLLEDLPDHRPGDDVAGLSPDEAELAVDLLADLHAPFWGRGLLLGVEPLVMGTAAQFDLAWDEVERGYGDLLPDAVRRHRARYISAIGPLHDWLLTGEVTLGHGDLKLDNILFGEADDPIVAVDWQAVRPQRGIRDLAYLLSHSMEVTDRRAHERTMLDRYVGALDARGVRCRADTLVDEYRAAILFDFCTALFIAGVNLNTNPRAVLRKRKLMERCTAALLDWDAFALLDHLP